ncbi:MAG: hypothetical protein NC925_02585 [Candidatus Omnitrophica bacterium]|nr:hypothetical protein [Candidatus Omnitrophota bacterium]
MLQVRIIISLIAAVIIAYHTSRVFNDLTHNLIVGWIMALLIEFLLIIAAFDNRRIPLVLGYVLSVFFASYSYISNYKQDILKSLALRNVSLIEITQPDIKIPNIEIVQKEKLTWKDITYYKTQTDLLNAQIKALENYRQYLKDVFEYNKNILEQKSQSKLELHLFNLILFTLSIAILQYLSLSSVFYIKKNIGKGSLAEGKILDFIEEDKTIEENFQHQHRVFEQDTTHNKEKEMVEIKSSNVKNLTTIQNTEEVSVSEASKEIEEKLYRDRNKEEPKFSDIEAFKSKTPFDLEKTFDLQKLDKDNTKAYTPQEHNKDNTIFSEASVYHQIVKLLSSQEQEKYEKKLEKKDREKKGITNIDKLPLNEIERFLMEGLSPLSLEKEYDKKSDLQIVLLEKIKEKFNGIDEPIDKLIELIIAKGKYFFMSKNLTEAFGNKSDDIEKLIGIINNFIDKYYVATTKKDAEKVKRFYRRKEEQENKNEEQNKTDT